MQKKILATCIMLSLSIHAFTQLTEIKNTVYKSNDRSINIEFPVINYFDKKIENAINKCIQTKILGLDSAVHYKSDSLMLKKSLYNKKEGVGGFTLLSYTAYCTEKILSIRFKGETMGVYPGIYTDNYTFNLRNGKLLQIDDLIVNDSSFNIYDTLYNLNKQEMVDAMTGIDSDIVDHVRTVIEESINERKAVDFYIFNDTIFFSHGPAGFSHAMQCYEMHFNTNYSLQDIRGHFTGLGSLVLLNDKKKYPLKNKIIKSLNWYY